MFSGFRALGPVLGAALKGRLHWFLGPWQYGVARLQGDEARLWDASATELTNGSPLQRGHRHKVRA